VPYTDVIEINTSRNKGKQKPAIHQYHVIKINVDSATEKLSVGQEYVREKRIIQTDDNDKEKRVLHRQYTYKG
jgi:hypothetical protein